MGDIIAKFSAQLNELHEKSVYAFKKAAVYCKKNLNLF